MNVNVIDCIKRLNVLRSTDQTPECLLVLLIRLWTPSTVSGVTARVPGVWCLPRTGTRGNQQRRARFTPAAVPTSYGATLGPKTGAPPLLAPKCRRRKSDFPHNKKVERFPMASAPCMRMRWHREAQKQRPQRPTTTRAQRAKPCCSPAGAVAYGPPGTSSHSDSKGLPFLLSGILAPDRPYQTGAWV